MITEQETASAATLTASQSSDTKAESCYGKSSQERKRAKVRARVHELTGCEMPYFMAAAIHDVVRSGLRVTNKEEEEAQGYRLKCSAEYHFVKMTGRGASLVPLLYTVSLRLANKSQNFHISLQEVAHYLGMSENDDSFYGAASLLVAAGFWEVIEKMRGKATKYRPLKHRDWAAKCGTEKWNDEQVGKFCTVKAEFPFKDATPEYALGRALYGITGEKYFNGVLKGWLKVGSIQELESWARDFMAEDAGKRNGVKRRVRLGQHFRACASRRTSG